VELMLADLREVIDAPREHVIAALMRWVPEYQPAGLQQTLPRLAVDADSVAAAA
jgi:hypothetical protein